MTASPAIDGWLALRALSLLRCVLSCQMKTNLKSANITRSLDPSIRDFTIAIDVWCICGWFHCCRRLESCNHLTDEAFDKVTVVVTPGSWISQNTKVNSTMWVRVVRYGKNKKVPEKFDAMISTILFPILSQFYIWLNSSSQIIPSFISIERLWLHWFQICMFVVWVTEKIIIT